MQQSFACQTQYYMLFVDWNARKLLIVQLPKSAYSSGSFRRRNIYRILSVPAASGQRHKFVRSLLPFPLDINLLRWSDTDQALNNNALLQSK